MDDFICQFVFQCSISSCSERTKSKPTVSYLDIIFVSIARKCNYFVILLLNLPIYSYPSANTALITPPGQLWVLCVNTHLTVRNPVTLILIFSNSAFHLRTVRKIVHNKIGSQVALAIIHSPRKYYEFVSFQVLNYVIDLRLFLGLGPSTRRLLPNSKCNQRICFISVQSRNWSILAINDRLH